MPKRCLFIRRFFGISSLGLKIIPTTPHFDGGQANSPYPISRLLYTRSGSKFLSVDLIQLLLPVWLLARAAEKVGIRQKRQK